MTRHSCIAGTTRQGNIPEWAPLEDLLWSDELCGHFMWMFDVELEDGTILNAYKHRWTRCYLHLTHDGRAFWYVGDEGYAGVAPRTALEAAFRAWEVCEPTASEQDTLRAALRRLSRRR